MPKTAHKLNDTQKELCSTSIEFILNSLNDFIQISKMNSNALNSAFLALRLSMKFNEEQLNFYLEKIYPQEKYAEIRQLFMEINELIFSRNPNHPFVKAICDERLTTLPESPDLRAEAIHDMQKEFSAMIKHELHHFLLQNKEGKQYNEAHVQRFAAQLKKLTRTEVEADSYSNERSHSP